MYAEILINIYVLSIVFQNTQSTTFTVDPDGRNTYSIEHIYILLVSIVFSILNQGKASIASFSSFANIIKTKCRIGEIDYVIDEISTLEFLILTFFLMISQIFRTGSLILLYSTMEYFAIIPIVLIFVNNIVLLSQIFYGKQNLQCKNSHPPKFTLNKLQVALITYRLIPYRLLVP